jgi:hypothetical protein
LYTATDLLFSQPTDPLWLVTVSTFDNFLKYCDDATGNVAATFYSKK